MLNVRIATLDDVESILSLIEATCKKVECFSRRTREYIMSGINGFVVAEEHGRLIGCGQIVVLAFPDTSEIHSMCVDEAHMGRDVGTRILKKLVQKSTTSRILVECVPANRHFYEKGGFEPIAFLKDVYSQKDPQDLYEAIKNYSSLCSRFPDRCPGIMMSKRVS